MENNQDPQAALNQVMEELADFQVRFNTFKEENAEYLKYIQEIGESLDWKVKPADPQDIQRTDKIIEKIENAGLEKELEIFEAMKYRAGVYHQLDAFIAEREALIRRASEIKLRVSVDLLEYFEDLLQNAQKFVAEGNDDEDLPEAIKMAENAIKILNSEKMQLELRLAATHPDKAN